MGFLNTIKDNLLDIVFPQNCLNCGKSGEYLCQNCLKDAPGAERPTLSWIYPLYDYRHPAIKKSIAFLKYKGRKQLVDSFSNVLHGKIMEELADLHLMENFSSPALIPIPLSPRRQKERGFNQAELLCRKIVQRDQENKDNNFVLMTNVLTKPNDTRHQAQIKDRGDRLTNLSGSFVVKNEESIKDRNIILIDDVTTTGATLTEARKVLKAAGARKVIAFTIAH